jgi:hypothetical protein
LKLLLRWWESRWEEKESLWWWLLLLWANRQGLSLPKNVRFWGGKEKSTRSTLCSGMVGWFSSQVIWVWLR